MPANAERGSVRFVPERPGELPPGGIWEFIVTCSCGLRYWHAATQAFVEQSIVDPMALLARLAIEKGWSIEPPRCPDCNRSA